MSKQQQQRLSLGINIIIPMIVLTKFSGEQALGTTRGLVVALFFPLAYGIRERHKEKEMSFISGLGIFSVLMTGGIGLLNLPTERIAIKEAMVPAIIGGVIFISMYTGHNFVEKMFLGILETEKIITHLEGKTQIRSDGIKNLTRRIIASFTLSTILNYTLATYIVTSPSGTEAFNEEIGRLTGLSFPAIALPATILLTIGLFIFLNKLHKETGLEIEDLLKKQ